MSFCHACGEALVQGWAFCEGCGAALPVAEAVVVTASTAGTTRLTASVVTDSGVDPMEDLIETSIQPSALDEDTELVVDTEPTAALEVGGNVESGTVNEAETVQLPSARRRRVSRKKVLMGLGVTVTLVALIVTSLHILGTHHRLNRTRRRARRHEDRALRYRRRTRSHE